MEKPSFLPGNAQGDRAEPITATEIYHQPELWGDTFDRVKANGWHGWQKWADGRGVLCGAGTSAYAAGAIQAAWPNSRAIATTDLITDSRALKHADFLLSLARSGDSPESVAVAAAAGCDCAFSSWHISLLALILACRERCLLNLCWEPVPAVAVSFR